MVQFTPNLKEGGLTCEMMVQATHFLASLEPAQKKRASFSTDDEERFNWHYVPRERRGIPFQLLTPAQRKLAHALIATGLSRRGYIQASNIMYLEQVLYDMEQQDPRRNADGYFFSIFGRPAEGTDWSWRVEGHHLSLNFTIRGGRVVSQTPLFFGANPARFEHGRGATWRVLREEEEMGRELLLGLEHPLREKALISVEAPADVITRADRWATPGPAPGACFDHMDQEQQEILRALLDLYARRLRSDLAGEQLKRIRRKGLQTVHFAWAGGTLECEPHYYRIQGAEFLIEYDNTQNSANHIHTVWRDLRRDFGRDPLREHYTRSHGIGTGKTQATSTEDG